MRPAAEKKLIDAVIDGEVAAQELIEEAKRDGKKYGDLLTKVSRAIVEARLSGRLSTAEARTRFKETYVFLSLAGFAEVAQQVADHSSQVAADIRFAAREMGGELAKSSPVRKADFMARKLEKAQGDA